MHPVDDTEWSNDFDHGLCDAHDVISLSGSEDETPYKPLPRPRSPAVEELGASLMGESACTLVPGHGFRDIPPPGLLSEKAKAKASHEHRQAVTKLKELILSPSAPRYSRTRQKSRHVCEACLCRQGRLDQGCIICTTPHPLFHEAHKEIREDRLRAANELECCNVLLDVQQDHIIELENRVEELSDNFETRLTTQKNEFDEHLDTRLAAQAAELGEKSLFDLAEANGANVDLGHRLDESYRKNDMLHRENDMLHNKLDKVQHMSVTQADLLEKKEKTCNDIRQEKILVVQRNYALQKQIDNLEAAASLAKSVDEARIQVIMKLEKELDASNQLNKDSQQAEAHQHALNSELDAKCQRTMAALGEAENELLAIKAELHTEQQSRKEMRRDLEDTVYAFREQNRMFTQSMVQANERNATLRTEYEIKQEKIDVDRLELDERQRQFEWASAAYDGVSKQNQELRDTVASLQKTIAQKDEVIQEQNTQLQRAQEARDTAAKEAEDADAKLLSDAERGTLEHECTCNHDTLTREIEVLRSQTEKLMSKAARQEKKLNKSENENQFFRNIIDKRTAENRELKCKIASDTIAAKPLSRNIPQYFAQSATPCVLQARRFTRAIQPWEAANFDLWEDEPVKRPFTGSSSNKSVWAPFADYALKAIGKGLLSLPQPASEDADEKESESQSDGDDASDTAQSPSTQVAEPSRLETEVAPAGDGSSTAAKEEYDPDDLYAEPYPGWTPKTTGEIVTADLPSKAAEDEYDPDDLYAPPYPGWKPLAERKICNSCREEAKVDHNDMFMPPCYGSNPSAWGKH